MSAAPMPKVVLQLPVTQQSDQDGYFRTDLGNAERFADLNGDRVKWVPNVGWHFWKGSHWERTGDDSAVFDLAARCNKQLYDEAKNAKDDEARETATKHALKSQSRARIEATAVLAKGRLLVPAESFDREPMLLNCLNGTIDLTKGELRPHAQGDYVTKVAPFAFDPRASCPRWEAFLERVVPSGAVRAYLQRLIGYTLTGSVAEQILVFLFGAGANGKSVCTGTVQALLGDYAATAPKDLLVDKPSDGHPTDVAGIWGRRLIVSSETEQGRWLAEAKVKSLTGGDLISARFMRRDFFTFRPTHKLWLFGNHQLRVRGTDHGIWRRIVQVPFTQQISDAEKDVHLEAKLRAELAGIAAWAVRGCLDWQRDGLRPPPEVVDATAEYRKSQDIIGRFIDEACIVGNDFSCAAAKLYTAYKIWAEKSGERVWTSTAFGTAIKEREFESEKTKTGRTYLGITPKNHDAVTGCDGFSGSPHASRSYETNEETRHNPSPQAASELDFGASEGATDA